MAGVRLPTHNTLKTTKMVQEKQLRELFKYIEANWDVCVSQVDKTDIKRIFGGVLCEDIMNDTLHEVKDEQPALNPIAEAYERGEKIRHKRWHKNEWIKKLDEIFSVDERGYNEYVDKFTFHKIPSQWELYTEPTEQPAQPSSQGKLDNSFDKDRFEAMFRAVVASGVQQNFECFKIDTTYFLQQIDAYYASKEGGNND